MPRFFGDAAVARLPSGDTPAFQPINGRFFIIAFPRGSGTGLLLTNTQPLRNGENPSDFRERFIIALGSTTNRAVFVIFEADMNNIKQMVSGQRMIRRRKLTWIQLWLLKNAIDPTNLRNWLQTTDHHGSSDPVVALVQVFRKTPISYLPWVSV